MDNTRNDPTKEPEFKRVLKNLLLPPHKPQSEVEATLRVRVR
jgi:hypothetical protein